MDTQEVSLLKSKFDELAHVDENTGIEFWYARELQEAFSYSQWRRFNEVIEKAKLSCKVSGNIVSNHFADVGKMVDLGSGATREIADVKLTRYACYLIAQNGDPRKEEIAFAQSYFAQQTRKQELIEEHMKNLQRLENRDKLRASEKELSKNIYERGVDDAGFGRIRSAGDCALFGRSTQSMKERYGVTKGRPLADFLPDLTIAAKNLATEMTNYNTKAKDLYGEPSITHEHVQNNSTIRNMLGERGIKPENLPPAEDIKKVERRVKSNEKKLAKDSCFKDK
ncbi:DNA damage-inducible protein D [Phascolarctobacterium succinatutens]|uniref:DNA damage-inducible protein D n=1 Tax=Phascolarctobacterium succinatutens TaxID=626940 RepID=UPI0026EEC1A8|nr:DNA damage-inducible protein D [Phascolarctobacterium succinatutens]